MNDLAEFRMLHARRRLRMNCVSGCGICAWAVRPLPISWLLEQCQRHNPRACGLVGQLLTYGVGIKRDLVRGKDLLARACKDGYALACEDLGSDQRPPPMLDQLERAEKLTSSTR